MNWTSTKKGESLAKSDRCGYGGRGVKKCHNIVDVFSGWPLDLHRDSDKNNDETIRTNALSTAITQTSLQHITNNGGGARI